MSIESGLFVFAAAALAYTYVAYPVVLMLLGGQSRRACDLSTLPTVSVIIPFHNEERWVAQKLHNTLTWDYPRDRLQIVAVSDGSTDRTREILQEFRDRATIVTYSPRRGKPTALNLGVQHATGEMLLFTDANVLVHPAAIGKLMERYDDPSIGGVCGNIALQAEGADEPLGEGLYMQYERWLYGQESRALTMVGVDGALFSIRRDLFAALPVDTITDDFAIALRVVGHRKRIVYEPAARGVEIVVPDVKAEFRRKVRMIAGGYQALWRYRAQISPCAQPTVAWQLLSRKLFRWLVPIFLVVAFAAAFAGRHHPMLAVAAGIQGGFYMLALGGWVSQTLRRWMPVYVAYYFCAVNVAAALGLWRYLLGRQSVIWQKVQR